MTPTPASAAVPVVIGAELKQLLRQVKLGRCLDTLPERLALARSRGLAHAEFLELVLSDEVTRRETTSAALRAKAAGLEPDMCLENWDPTAKVAYDHAVWDELCSLRFLDAGHNVLVMGPVGVGKTFLPPPWGMPPSGAVTPSPSTAPTCCSSICAPPGWTTATTARSANCCASIC